MYETATPLTSARASTAPRHAPRMLLPARLREWLVLLCYAFAAVTLPFDKFTQGLREDLLQGAIVVLFLTTLPARGSWRAVGATRRMRWTLIGTLAALVLAWLPLAFVDRPGIGIGTITNAFCKQFPVLHLAIGWWFFTGFMIDVRPRRDPARSRLALTASLVIAFLTWSFVTCFASVAPDTSFRMFVSEIAIYAPFFLYLLSGATRGLPHGRAMERKVARAGWGGMFLGIALAAAVGGIYLLATPALKQNMEQLELGDSELIRRDTSPDLLLAMRPTVRLSFPTGHHNRLAYFALVAALLFLARAALTHRRFWLAAALVALAVLGGTLNRGGTLALGLALVVFVCARWRARGLLFIPAIAVLYLFLPNPWVARLTTLANPQTYENPTSTLVYRMQHWQVAWVMLKNNPLMGIGYGWDTFQRAYGPFTLEHGLRYDKKVHAHNIWLEVAAETGVPGLLLFLAFNAVRWAWLLRLWRRRDQLTQPQFTLLCCWLALETAIQCYCLINLPLRRSLGLLTWGVWLLMTLDLARLERAATRHAPETLTKLRQIQ